MPNPDLEPRELLRSVFDAAVAAADPKVVLAPHLPAAPSGRCIVVGAGKSAALMAQAVEDAWPDVPLSGLVVTRYGHAVPTKRIEVVEASHPVPDQAGLDATRRIMSMLEGLNSSDLVLVLISGGGSALLTLPAEGLSLADKVELNRALLASGLAISQMNAIRRRASAVKGGRLAMAASPAQVVTLAISDVPGDSPADIASGPTVADPTAEADLTDLISRLDISEALKGKIAGRPTQQCAFKSDYRVIATPMMALKAAAAVAREAGVTPLILGDAIEGEACEMGRVMAGIALSTRKHGYPVGAPAVLLSGGEGTVTISQSGGRGGRNMEFILSLAVELNGTEGIHAIACDTDGIDGTEDAAGAIVDPGTLTRAAKIGADARAYLSAHDSYSLFERLDDLVRTGPTLTNVNDFRAILIR